MCDLVTYRARIGGHNIRCYSRKCLFVKIDDIIANTNLNPVHLLCLLLVLIISGDVEKNPGPSQRFDEDLSDISTTSPSRSIKSDERHLNILHLNTQSIRKKLDKVEAECIGYDIVCLTETWLNKNINSKTLKLHGFNPPFRKDRPDGYGGVAIYISENLSAVKRPDLDVNGLEALWIEVRHPQLKSLFCAMYRPPKSKVAYWNLIEESLEKAKSSNIKHQFVMGDLNCNILIQGNKLKKVFDKFNFDQIINEPTHTQDNSNKCLDIIATTSKDLIKSHGVLPVSTSNHKAVYAILKADKPKQKTYKREIWLTRDVNWDNLNNDLKNHDWKPTLKQKDINSMILHWSETFLDIVRKHIKRIQVTVRPSDAKWMTTEIRNLIGRKNRYYKTAKKKNTPAAWDKFKNLRSLIKDKIHLAKANHDKTITDKINTQGSTNPKVWWSLAKEFYNNSCSSRQLSNPIISDGKILTDDISKANALNNFFVDQTLINTNGKVPPDLPNRYASSLNTINITSSTVKDIIGVINTSKSCGPDPITPLIIKKTGNTIAPVLAKIFNFSIKSSMFPDSWKLAHVVPLHKKDDESYCKNYRPISLLPCLSKVFERCVFKDVFNHLHLNKRISKLQAAYSPCNSTEYQLLELYHIIAKSMDEDKTVRFVFCDVSKAFDRVWHEGLVVKLRAIGIGGGLLKWFQSYVSNRNQRVVLNGQMSEIKRLHAGVPQGSILGPLLFLIYINDICDEIQSNIRLYADDSILFAIGDNHKQLHEDLTKDIDNISKWADKWCVTFNPNKTESLVVSNKLKSNIPPLHMNFIPILEVKSHKHLGCTLDCNHKWNSHISEIVTKASRRVDILRSLKYRFSRKSLEILYTSFIRPILEYSQSVWNNCTQAHKSSIESVQLAAMRVITGGIRGTSHDKLYQETKFVSTYERRHRHCMVIFYKIVHGYTPEYLRELLPPKVHTRNRYEVRNSNEYSQYNNRTITYSNTYFPKHTKIWNDIDDSIKYIGSLRDFKLKLKESDKSTPKIHYIGERKWQLMHTRMRMRCSALRDDLFKMHIVPDASCDCGHPREDAHHFFFACPNYTHIRHSFHNIHPSITHSVTHFLQGKPNAPYKLNADLFEIVISYIQNSNRF